MADEICSYCYKNKPTVDRNMFDGLCADCTDKALNNDHIAESAKKNNTLIKLGFRPLHECPCESTYALVNCTNNNNCDGVYLWSRPDE